MEKVKKKRKKENRTWKPLLGFDYSAHPDCIFQTEVEHFDPLTQTATLESEEGNFSVKITEKISEESESDTEKFFRIFDILKNAETLDKNLLEGVEFNDEQIGDLILHRVFGGNPHAESAMQAKVIAMLLEGKQDETLLAEVMQKKAKINEVREFFGLAEI